MVARLKALCNDAGLEVRSDEFVEVDVNLQGVKLAL